MYIFISLIGIAVAALLVSSCSLMVRGIIALIKGDDHEYIRLTTSYEVAEFDAIMNWGKTHGVTREIFAKYWEREQKRNPRALPYDAYISIMEELTIAHEPDPDIWSK